MSGSNPELPAVVLREATAGDSDFIRSLFFEVKGSELAPMGLPTEPLRQLLDMQYAARCRHYEAAFPGALNWIICNLEEPVGYVLVYEAEEVRIVDFAVAERNRGRGFGSAALGLIVDRFRGHRAISLGVERENPALRLYERLGFAIRSESETRYEMVLQPEP